MARKRFSQREAVRLWKQLQALEGQVAQQRRAWAQTYVGGVEIARCSWDSSGVIPVALRTARKLGHAVVVTGDDGGGVVFHALPLTGRTV